MMIKFLITQFLLLLVVLFCTACHPCCLKESYQSQYRHRNLCEETLRKEQPFAPSDYFLILLVDAKHLDYSDAESLVSTIAKHPDGSRERDVGHAWMLLAGIQDGKKVLIEGGHSGELGINEPRYLERVVLNSCERNPVRHLFYPLQDGYFEVGPGQHLPTYAIRVELNQKTFQQILELIQPDHYHFRHYSLTDNQCTTFVAKVATLAGLQLEHETIIPIPQYMKLARKKICLWRDSQYATITISTPDKLEKSMIEAVVAGQARVALRHYYTVPRHHVN